MHLQYSNFLPNPKVIGRQWQVCCDPLPLSDEVATKEKLMFVENGGETLSPVVFDCKLEAEVWLESLKAISLGTLHYWLEPVIEIKAL